ncbi:MAG: N-acetylmuramoyl-L-alanine amidase [Bacteroidales bacterium]|nr:N-acetylmuramoyl-L-alanine amidase [Bacteroidales bacterium]
MSNLPIRRIVLHYSATFPDQDWGVTELRRLHLARGWKDVGYHYVIRRDGRIERGRAEDVIGAHVEGHNTGSIGVCCIGGLERATGKDLGVDNRTPAQIVATTLLLRDLLARHPGAEVLGHRDLAPTQCPGFDVKTWWAQVNAEARGGVPGSGASAPSAVPGLRGILAAIRSFIRNIFRRPS